MALNLKATLALDGSGFAAGARLVSTQLAGLKSLIGSTFTVGAVAGLSRSTLNYAGQLTDLSKRLGVSTDFLQEFQFIAKQTGTDLETLTRVLEKVRESRETALGAKGGTERGLFALLGVSPDALANARLEDLIFGPISKSLSGADVQGRLGAAWREIGGKGAGELISAFTENLAARREEIRNNVAFMSQVVVDELDRIGDQLDVFSLQIKGGLGKALIFLVNAMGFTIHKIESFVLKLRGKPTISDEDFIKAQVANINERSEELKKAQRPSAPRTAEPLLINETKHHKAAIATDSLISVGNFLGKGPQIINQIAETNKILNTHTRLLSDINRKMIGSSGFPTT